MKWLRTVLCLAGAAVSSFAIASERYPRPDFDDVYHPPSIPWPESGFAGDDLMNILLLAAALVLTTYLLLKRRSRRAIVGLSLLCLLYFGFIRHGCLCAVGAAQPVAESLFSGQAITLLAVCFFVLPLVAALLFGRVFCGAVCPLGAIQDVVAVRPQTLSRGLTAALELIPVIYLSLAVLLAATGTGYIICRFDPFVSLFRLSGMTHAVLMGGFLLLLGIIVARPYCRFLCPYGVLLRWCSRLSWRHVTITPDECIQCKLCADSCPFDAIEAPSPDKPAEPRHTGVRRLAIIFLTAPLIVLGSGWAFSRLGPVLAQAHIDTQTYDQLLAEERNEAEPTVETAAVRLSERSADEIGESVATRRRRLTLGGWLAGGFVGLVVVARLLMASRRTHRTDYEPDRGRCLSCARCIRYCPVEHARPRKDEDATHA